MTVEQESFLGHFIFLILKEHNLLFKNMVLLPEFKVSYDLLRIIIYGEYINTEPKAIQKEKELYKRSDVHIDLQVYPASKLNKTFTPPPAAVNSRFYTSEPFTNIQQLSLNPLLISFDGAR